jgi:hypothetical protein
VVNIILTNKNELSCDRQVTINIVTGMCLFPDNRQASLNYLLRESDFIHPLLSEVLSTSSFQVKQVTHQAFQLVFHYEYDDIDGLLRVPIFVYVTLLRAKKPLTCKFKIKPSLLFSHANFATNIDFSINYLKPAAETIKIKQLEAIIKDLKKTPFKFSENILIDTEFSTNELPNEVDGDSLYNTDPILVDLLKTPHDFKRYELRYINPIIGLGLFSKTLIKKDEIISFYSGMKTHLLLSTKYAFVRKLDALNFFIDANLHGNISRFLNHAPMSDIQKCLRPNKLGANVRWEIYSLNGVQIIVYKTIKEIWPGEQLLIDYGDMYFKNNNIFYFKPNGKFFDNRKKFLSYLQLAPNKLQDMKIMANHGVQKAQVYFLLRMLLIFLISLLFFLVIL